MFDLQTRDEFREAVFTRDGHKCVMCGSPGQDAHHVLERRLWTDGGYYLENGATVCGPCHIKAEATDISCEELREAAGIEKFPLPEHFYRDQVYDKWGNPILPNGTRLRGELYQDESFQKIAAKHLPDFTTWVKYPRTYHLPWSHGATKDDRTLKSVEHFEEQEVVVTVKMDGEQTTMYHDHIHARSLESSYHASRTWVRNLQGQMGWEIPKGWRVCGENLFAKHSIYYENLKEYFQVFSIWDEQNEAISWEQTVEWSNLLGLTHVPVLYQGIWDEGLIQKLFQENHEGDPMEGYVVRLAKSFHYKDFPKAIAKFVRKDHVQTHGHWMRAKLEPNKRKDK